MRAIAEAAPEDIQAALVFGIVVNTKANGDILFPGDNIVGGYISATLDALMSISVMQGSPSEFQIFINVMRIALHEFKELHQIHIESAQIA